MTPLEAELKKPLSVTNELFVDSGASNGVTPRRILFVASEVAPLVKVGGLADVVGALPAALARLGHDVRILIPKYGVIAPELIPVRGRMVSSDVPWQGRAVNIGLDESRLPGTAVPLYLLDAPGLFSGGTIYYEHSGSGGARLAMERYVFFSWAVSRLLPQLKWSPDIIHCHDWHTAAVPALLSLSTSHPPITVLTIHNMEGQGKWRAEEVFGWLGIRGDELPALRRRDAPGNLNLLQLGIWAATAVNTVSPTYAQEVLTPTYGQGLERDLAGRPGGVGGILNGIDFRVFDPATDAGIFARYDVTASAIGKLSNKRALVSELGLRPGHGPLFGFVGRLTAQKGMDLLPASIPDIVVAGGQLVVLGSGVPEVERLVATAVRPYADHCRVLIKFDPRLAQRIYAASDFFLMPSRFEPCGLGQMIAMRYGALPIVRDTGGLHDTVRDVRTQPNGTGLLFRQAEAADLRGAVAAALQLFKETDTITVARRRAMTEDFSWHRSAQAYVALYEHALQAR